MACCGICDDQENDEIMRSIKRDRGCTDILWLLAFIMSWVGLIYIIIQAEADGANPERVYKGVDLEGRICGVDAGVENKPYAAWPSLYEYEYNICVESCDYTDGVIADSPDMAMKYKTVSLLNFCVPGAEVSDAAKSAWMSSYDGYSEELTKGTSDMYTARWYIFGAGWVALVLVFVYNVTLRCFAKILVWLIILGVFLGGVLGSYALFQGASDAEEEELGDNTVMAYQIFAGIATAVTVIYLVIILWLRKDINTAVEIVKESSRALGDLKMMILFPLLPLFTSIGYVALWLFIAMYLYSAADETTATTPTAISNYDVLTRAGEMPFTSATTTNPANSVSYETMEAYQYAGAYHFFHLLWNMQFLFYFTYLVIAGACAEWYFTFRDENGDKKTGLADDEMSPMPTVSSCKRVCRYHLGTVAVTSLIIAIVQFLQAVVHYIEKKCASDPPNQLQKAVFCCIKCCLKCAECCLDKISKNALIWTAVTGEGFFTAACASFSLLLRNVKSVIAINIVASFLIFLGKFCVAVLTTGLFALILTSGPVNDDLNSSVAPLIIIFVMSYTIASLIFIVFETVIDTIYLCFLIDAEFNKNNPNQPMFADATLQEIIGKKPVGNVIQVTAKSED